MKFLFGLMILSSFAHGAEFILSPKADCRDAQVRAVLKYSSISSSVSVFSDSEQKYLKAQGLGSIACAVKITTTAKFDVAEFKSWLKGKNLSFSIENNVPVTPKSFQDPLVVEQWGMLNVGRPQLFDVDDFTTLNIKGTLGEDVGLTGVSEASKIGRKIKVAILDTGVDEEHPDLKSQVYSSKLECEGVAKFRECLKTEKPAECDKKWNKDNDGNGYPLDCHGWNVTGKVNRANGIMGDSDTSDKIGHGTHIAGVIAAAVNKVGIRGVAPQSEILAVKVLNNTPNGARDR